MNHPISSVHWDDRHTEGPLGYKEGHCDTKEPVCQSFCGFYEIPARRIPGPAEIYNGSIRRQNLLDDSILKCSTAFWRISQYHSNFGDYRDECTDINLKGAGLMIPSSAHLAVPDVKHFPKPSCNDCLVDNATLNNTPWVVLRDSYLNKPSCQTCKVKPF